MAREWGTLKTVNPWPQVPRRSRALWEVSKLWQVNVHVAGISLRALVCQGLQDLLQDDPSRIQDENICTFIQLCLGIISSFPFIFRRVHVHCVFSLVVYV